MSEDTPVTANPRMPPEIAKAIVQVMSKVTILAKETKNQQGGYKFVSVDQFYEAIGPLMAEAGIFVVALESSMDVVEKQGRNGPSNWLTSTYDMMIYHESGVEFGPIKRSIQVVASGPQSYASGVSFVEKYFLRSLFKVPTGDADADSDPKRELPATKHADNGRDINEDLKEAEEAKVDFIRNAKVAWKSIKTQAELKAWYSASKEALKIVFFASTDGGREDPRYLEFVAAYKDIGRSLPDGDKPSVTAENKPAENKPADKQPDNIPDIPSSKTPRKSVSVIRYNFKDSLAYANTEDEANMVYAKEIEPFEASLNAGEIAEFVKLLREHVAKIAEWDAKAAKEQATQK